MNITITGCENCVFREHSFDDDGDEFNVCSLIRWNIMRQDIHLPLENYFIDFYKNYKVKSVNIKTLDNCPLLKNCKIEIKLEL
jgi:hypothetical protein